MGLKTDPCGTPHSCSCFTEVPPSTKTYCMRLINKIVTIIEAFQLSQIEYVNEKGEWHDQQCRKQQKGLAAVKLRFGDYQWQWLCTRVRAVIVCTLTEMFHLTRIY